MTATWPTGWATGDVTLASEYKKGIGAIADTTLGGIAANIDMTSISGTYAHLLVVVYARGDTPAPTTGFNMQFNGDTAANYDYQQMVGSAAVIVNSENFASTRISHGAMPANSAGANLFNASVMFIPHYAGTANNKVVISINASKSGTSTGNMLDYTQAGFWRSNAAINRITLFPAAGNFVAGTRVTLYGMGA